MPAPDAPPPRLPAARLLAYGGLGLPLVALYGLVPVAIKLLATLLVWNFPITEEVQAELRTRLA